MSTPNIPNIIKDVEDAISSGSFSVQSVDTFPAPTAGPFSSIVVCMCCGKDKAPAAPENYTKDVISHGLCAPLCDEGKKAGWAKFIRKEYGGEL